MRSRDPIRRLAVLPTYQSSNRGLSSHPPLHSKNGPNHGPNNHGPNNHGPNHANRSHSRAADAHARRRKNGKVGAADDDGGGEDEWDEWNAQDDTTRGEEPSDAETDQLLG